MTEDESAVVEAIAASRHEWLTRLRTGDLDGYLGALAPDAVWMPPQGPAVTGAAALRAWLAPSFAQYRCALTLEDVRMRVAGDRAFERGAFHSALTPLAGGEPLVHVGRYALFWRRDADRSWRIERYVDETELRALAPEGDGAYGAGA